MRRWITFIVRSEVAEVVVEVEVVVKEVVEEVVKEVVKEVKKVVVVGVALTAQRLADRVEEDIDQVDVLRHRHDRVLHRERVLEGAVDQAGRVDEGDHAEELLARGAHL